MHYNELISIAKKGGFSQRQAEVFGKFIDKVETLGFGGDLEILDNPDSDELRKACYEMLCATNNKKISKWTRIDRDLKKVKRIKRSRDQVAKDEISLKRLHADTKDRLGIAIRRYLGMRYRFANMPSLAPVAPSANAKTVATRIAYCAPTSIDCESFHCDVPGENSSACCDYECGLSIGHSVKIKNSYDLSNYMRFKKGGYVKSVKLQKNPTKYTPWPYEIQIKAKGPKGLLSGSGYTFYMDRTYDTYSLSVWSSSLKCHEVDYKSSDPNIIYISWSNKILEFLCPIFSFITQQQWFSFLFDLAGFFSEKNAYGNVVYHAKVDALQQYGGYNALYDMIFDQGTSATSERFTFKAGGEEYAIWAWRGDYLNLGAGAELGIYQKVKGVDHYKVNRSISMRMTLKLYVNLPNPKLVDYYRPNKKQWWITSFVPKFQRINVQNTKAEYSVDFSQQNALYKGFKQKYGKHSKWRFNDENRTAYFTFDYIGSGISERH